MDQRLADKLNSISEQIDVLRPLESAYLELEAHRKVLFAQLFLKTDGKNITERESQVYASADWMNFIAGLTQAETDLNHARRVYELTLKAYDAEHLTLKTEVPAIRRQGA